MWSFIWRLWVYINAVFWLILLSPITYISTFFPYFKFTNFIIRLWSQLVYYGAGLRYEIIENKEVIPDATYMIISNHTSLMDIPLMYILHPNNPLTFVGKKEVEKYPIIGQISKKVVVLVDRSSKESRAKVYPLVKNKVKQSQSPVIFPEGGVPDGDIVLAPFKDGAFSIAIACQLPILVYSFENMKEIFPFDSHKGYPGKVRVKLLKIIETKGLTMNDKNRIKEEAYQLIYNDLVDYIQDNHKK